MADTAVGNDQLTARSGQVEALVRQAFDDALVPGFQSGLATLAVGGFGRRELFPYSDVDIILLVECEPHSAKEREAISKFLRILWDAGLRLSHSVRTVEECCTYQEQNIELTISLLDERFLTGDVHVYQSLTARLPQFFAKQSTVLSLRLCELTRARQAKFNDTIYHLEPNIKEAPGGLRDLQVSTWLGRLDSQPAMADLSSARDFLFGLRRALHEHAKRDNNVLTFDAQDELSDDPARMMREYYRHARSVYRVCRQAIELAEERRTSLFSQFRDWRSRLSNADFTLVRDRVYLRAPLQIQQDPQLVFRLFQWIARHNVRLAIETEQRLAEFALDPRDSAQRIHWQDWIELLSLPHASLALNSMHDSGVLAAFLPEWKGIECLVMRDFYHRYTVDEHTLVTIQTLENLQEQRFRDLLEESPDAPLLRFALLLHDIGKGGTGEGHVTQSLAIAKQILSRLNTPQRDSEIIYFLIAKHLDLSAVMTSRDLNDPGTARWLADSVGTIERLKLLTLLTFADISAVNSHTMTPWRMEQLWRVYLLAYDELTRELQTERIHSTPAQTAEIAEFLEGFPTRYLRTHNAEEMKFHSELAMLSRLNSVGIDIRRQNGVYLLTLVTADKPALFAAVSGILASFGLNILKAEAFANSQGVVLDTFVFADPLRTLELNATELERLRGTIAKVIRGRMDLDQLLKNRRVVKPPGKKSGIEPRVAFNDDASQSATLIEITAQDRPGLLYDLSRALSASGCNIEVVLIDTEAHRALDVFYVTADGGKVSQQLQAKLQQSLLAACAGQLAAT